MIMGFPGSGKSSIVGDYQKKNYARLNRDELGGTIAGLLPRMEALISTGKDAVMDNLFLSAADRKPFIQRAKKMGATVTVVHKNTAFEECLVNVCHRMYGILGRLPEREDYKNAKDPGVIPPAAMFTAKKQLEKPSLEEGMDVINVSDFKREYPAKFVNKALFLDFDGCLRDCPSGADFPCKKSDVRVLPNRTKVLEKFKKDGYVLVGASNQSGVGKGQLTAQDAVDCFDETCRQLGVAIDYAFCPHRIPPMACYCRKPQPGIGVHFIHKYKLDPRQCIMVGDLTSDETFAKRLGMEFVDAEKFFR
jgi:histidinol-phosphate phosphatase family protein